METEIRFRKVGEKFNFQGAILLVKRHKKGLICKKCVFFNDSKSCDRLQDLTKNCLTSRNAIIYFSKI
jgi:hypothetical protein